MINHSEGQQARRNVTATPATPIELRVRGDFISWLAASGGTLAVTTYNSGKLVFVSARDGRIETRVWRFERPMGLAVAPGTLAVATRNAIWEFRLDAERPQCFRACAQYHTGQLDAHDLAFGARGLYFANTRFNCVARASHRVHFLRHWRPPSVDPLARKDACHLNGLALRAGRPALVTAFCAGGAVGAWRTNDRHSNGVVYDIHENRVVVSGLCMPHSPRRHNGQWWLCNSGHGTLCRLNPQRGDCEVVAMLPAFTRGLYFANGRAVVGLSRIRRAHILDAPPVRERFPRLRAGVALVDVHTTQETGRLEFIRGGREVYDVAFLAGMPSAQLLVEPSAELSV